MLMLLQKNRPLKTKNERLSVRKKYERSLDRNIWYIYIENDIKMYELKNEKKRLKQNDTE